MRSTKQRPRGCKSTKYSSNRVLAERKTVLSLCCRAGCEKKKKKKGAEARGGGGGGGRCRRRRIGMPRCYYSRSKADGRRRGARGNPRFISQSVTPGLLLLCRFKGYRIPPPRRSLRATRAAEEKRAGTDVPNSPSRSRDRIPKVPRQLNAGLKDITCVLSVCSRRL